MEKRRTRRSVHRLELNIERQPDFISCGPTCLHAAFRYWGEDLPLNQVLSETQMLEEGGTLGVLLACHALKRGYRVTIHSYNLHLFDPSWYGAGRDELQQKFREQMKEKNDPKLRTASLAYLDFLDAGGALRFEDLSGSLIQGYLDRSVPILAGLSATFLYRSKREFGPDSEYDDLRGEPSGHFVVLRGYDRKMQTIAVADPLFPNPLSTGPLYDVGLDRLIGAIYLGIVTYDANLLVLEPA